MEDGFAGKPRFVDFYFDPFSLISEQADSKMFCKNPRQFQVIYLSH